MAQKLRDTRGNMLSELHWHNIYIYWLYQMFKVSSTLSLNPSDTHARKASQNFLPISYDDPSVVKHKCPITFAQPCIIYNY